MSSLIARSKSDMGAASVRSTDGTRRYRGVRDSKPDCRRARSNVCYHMSYETHDHLRP